ncbi:unnamed protein product [Rotaria magnacalcarata]|uniref:Small integral membrane protein 14 n=1 Tax=Rotaria magnacalcarata TaxID=392030 RepID=A0A8S2IYQ7_9BILA|nr:unnamed protein product [Rotaria magnacalcarata]
MVTVPKVCSSVGRTSPYFYSVGCLLISVPGQPNADGGNTGMTNMYLMIGIWLAIAFLLFIFRPRTLRNSRDNLGKPDNQGPRRDNREPPTPGVD